MDGLSCLREAIATVPVPGAPPRFSRDGAVVGLAFLDAALRLNHVRRLTERLSFIEHRIARRTTEVDISLNMLDRGQRAAAALLQQITSHTFADAEYTPKVENTVWVPVARIARSTAAPIDVRDSTGKKIPRLTQYETSRLMASGLYKLLRESLRSHPNSSNLDTDLNRILFKIHEPRWIIEAALLTLFTERNKPAVLTVRQQTPGTVDGHVRQYRQLALAVFEEYASYLKDYLALLDVALNEQLLVVALDATRDEHLLTYDSPLYVNERPATFKRLWRMLRASGEGYYVQYHTSIPSTLRSYHLVFESGTGVDISKIYLSTDADAKTVESVTSDLTLLASRLESEHQAPMGDPARKVLELETQTVLRRMAEVVRRREWEASHAEVSLPHEYLHACFRLRQAAVAGEATPGRDGTINNALLSHPNISPGNLRSAAQELIDKEMSYDLSLEGDPVTNRAHAYWRRAPERSVNSGPIKIRAGAILRDATGAGPRDAILYAAALAGISYLVSCFLTRSAWPYGLSGSNFLQSIRSPEAIIAVLLVIPGFLYTRLTIPDPHSISGHLRAIPRFVVRVCIFSMVIVAASIAADSDGQIVRIAFAIGTLLPIVSTIPLFRKRTYSLKEALGRMGAPRWAGDDKTDRARSVAPDVRFFSSGERGNE